MHSSFITLGPEVVDSVHATVLTIVSTTTENMLYEVYDIYSLVQ